MTAHDAEARGDIEFGDGVERGHEATRDHIKQLGFRFIEMLGVVLGRDNREVIRHQGVVENTFIWLDPTGIKHALRVYFEVAP